jgi:hypothetical protein
MPLGYESGDYAQLHSNGGSGAVDWNTPVSAAKYDLFPNGGGIYGFGHAPFGNFRWGQAHCDRVAGFGHLPFGLFPWGHGTAVIAGHEEVTVCGQYKYGYACYDEAGNVHQGSPEEIDIEIHIAPPAPTGLTKNSYNKGTDVLVLDAA